jgi:endonuclease III related protein
MRSAGTRLQRLYGALFDAYGPQGWWPLASMAGRRGFDSRGYHAAPAPRSQVGARPWPRKPAQRFEIAVGAVLTQNTAWTNVEKALASLAEAGVRLPAHILELSPADLAGLIRSSGYHNQKARSLAALSAFFSPSRALRAGCAPRREELLSVRGVGEETADSILLYAFGEPFFVVDAYTRRLLSRIGLIAGRERYGEIRSLLERSLPRDAALYAEFHALVVCHAKNYCRARPLCTGCPVSRCRSREGRVVQHRRGGYSPRA